MTRPAGTAACVPSPPVITALTGIRALAAAAVVLYHLREPLFTLVPTLRVLDTWLIFGFLGVDVFFVLSGFIISYNYAERFATVGRRAYARYLGARFARIYPVHLVTLLIVAVAVIVFGLTGIDRDLGFGSFVGNLLMLQALPGVPAWNGASWSISCEAAAYLVFPFGAAALLRLRRRTALVLLALVTVLLVGATTTLGLVMADPAIGLFWVRIAGEFTLGCLMWAAWRHGARQRRQWDLVAAAAMTLVFVLLAVPAVRLVYWVVVPLLALFVVATANATGAVRAVLASRPMEWGGRISYSLYLVHVPALSAMFAVLPPGGLVDASLAFRTLTFVAYAGGCVLAAALIYYVIEEPARARLRPQTATRQGWIDPTSRETASARDEMAAEASGAGPGSAS